MAQTAPPRAHAGDLDALLALERSLGERLAAARAEADRILREAQDDVARREAALAEDLAARARELEARLAADRERRLAAVAEAARRRIAAWDAIDDASVDRAAGAVADALIAGPRGARR